MAPVNMAPVNMAAVNMAAVKKSQKTRSQQIEKSSRNQTMLAVVIITMLALIAGYISGKIQKEKLTEHITANLPKQKENEGTGAISKAGQNEIYPQTDKLENAKDTPEKPQDEELTGVIEPENTETETEPKIIKKLLPIVTNMQGTENIWVRLEASVIMKAHTESEQEVLAGIASDKLLQYLRSIKASQLEGPSGYLHFKREIRDILASESEEKISDVLINFLVME